jgi:signal transduction histidine kinase
MTPAEQLARDASTVGAPDEESPPIDHHVEIERLRAENARLRRERDAAEGFVALAAHELMAPLVLTEACVTMAAERLDADYADVLQAFMVLGRGARRTRRLVESLLHEAQASSRPFRAEVVDLTELAGECIGLLGPEIAARSAHVELGALPEVAGEPELLGGLITNLLMNALKFNPRQDGAVQVGCERHGDAWVIHVDSEGPPIPDEERERIFEPFHRGRGERRTRGAGLGLAICRRIAERHGGNTGVVTAPGGDGNRFYFTLPV